MMLGSDFKNNLHLPLPNRDLGEENWKIKAGSFCNTAEVPENPDRARIILH